MVRMQSFFILIMFNSGVDNDFVSISYHGCLLLFSKKYGKSKHRKYLKGGAEEEEDS